MSESRDSFLRVALIGALIFAPFAVPAALAAGAETIEEVVVVGSRRAGRTATDSPVPVDVVSGDEFNNMGTSDMDDMLRNLLPSYNVQTEEISDAATITRPATLRGLPPDNVLVLVNGKRRHRAAVIAELGGSLAAGSQGPDMSVFPALAIQRVEVLRDGAAAQYGSDAIAGVINIVLKEANSGLTFEAKYGEYAEGDGESTLFGINWGLPLGDNGFANLTLQLKENDATSRSLQKTNAVGQIALGNTDIINPVQVWGSPEVDDDISFFVNAGIELTDSQELYGFGNYAERKVTGGFFFRNPNGRPNAFTEDFSRSNRAIIDLNFDISDVGLESNCPVLLSAGRGTVSGSLVPTAADQAIADADQAALAALPSNCWVVNNVFPAGYTPSFGGDVEDLAGVVGLRGTLDNGLGYDFSVGLARNETAFRIENTGNWSLGPESPTDKFELGKYIQTEQTYNADFVMPFEVEWLYSDLNVAFGAEYRAETFEIRQGQEESWVAGPYGTQNRNFHSDGVTPLIPMVVGAHGFAGFGPTQVGEFERSNYAIYTDLEADVTENFLLGVAVRFEDFEDFGTTTNYKLSGRWAITPDFALRASVQTGFRAPTPGQSNVTKISTITVDGELQQQGTIPPTNPIAGFLGGKPLDAEDADNFSVGMSWDIMDDLTVTLDYYNIEITDRITQTGTIDISSRPIPTGVNCPGSTNLAQCLQELGIPGASLLSSVSFFTNDFDTTTQGFDLVATYVHDWENAGLTNFTAAWNWTETEVDSAGVVVSRDRLLELEQYNPENRGIFTLNHFWEDFRFLIRASFYDDWVDGSVQSANDPVYQAGKAANPNSTAYQKLCADNRAGINPGADNCYDGEWVFDIEAAYTLNERYTFTLGAQNVFDQDAPKDNENTAPLGLSNNSGEEFTSSSHWGINGAFYYLRFSATFD